MTVLETPPVACSRRVPAIVAGTLWDEQGNGSGDQRLPWASAWHGCPGSASADQHHLV